jgi:hypothetical protein
MIAAFLQLGVTRPAVESGQFAQGLGILLDGYLDKRVETQPIFEARHEGSDI